MPSTVTADLERWKVATPSSPAWNSFVEQYRSFINRWVRRALSLVSVQHADIDELTDAVLAVVVRKLPGYKHRGPGTFRAWLKQICRLQAWAWWRREARRRPLAGFDMNQVAQAFDEEYDRDRSAKVVEWAEQQLDPRDWRIIWITVVEGRKAADAAALLGISVEYIRVRKSRTLAALKERAEAMGSKFPF